MLILRTLSRYEADYSHINLTTVSTTAYGKVLGRCGEKSSLEEIEDK
jgi:hypothetical protein